MHFEVVILINLAIKNPRQVSERLEDFILFAKLLPEAIGSSFRIQNSTQETKLIISLFIAHIIIQTTETTKR
jgi:hypothetical protein